MPRRDNEIPKISGIVITLRILITAVKDIDKATSPFANEVSIFDVAPPGAAAKIITPMAISKPNSCTILMEVVIRARKPMDVVRLVKNITLDIWTIVSSMAFSGSLFSLLRFSLNLAWMWIASPIPIIKRRVGTIYVMILISKPIKPMDPKSHITVMRTVKIGRRTWTQ